MQRYVAIAGKNIRLTSVLAKSEDEARERIAHELSKPGRTRLLIQWRGDGSRLEVEK
jgi:hypothetical protein